MDDSPYKHTRSAKNKSKVFADSGYAKLNNDQVKARVTKTVVIGIDRAEVENCEVAQSRRGSGRSLRSLASGNKKESDGLLVLRETNCVAHQCKDIGKIEKYKDVGRQEILSSSLGLGDNKDVIQTMPNGEISADTKYTKSPSLCKSGTTPQEKHAKKAVKKAKLSLAKKSSAKGSRGTSKLKLFTDIFENDTVLNQTDDFKDDTLNVKFVPKNKNAKPLKRGSRSTITASKRDGLAGKENEDLGDINAILQTTANKSSNATKAISNNENEDVLIPETSVNGQTEIEHIESNGVDTRNKNSKTVVKQQIEEIQKCPSADQNEQQPSRSSEQEKTQPESDPDKKESDGEEENQGKGCPTCKAVVELDKFREHILQCMRTSYGNHKTASLLHDQEESDETLARQLQKREEEKLKEEKATDEKFLFCQFCQKDLSKLNSHRRLQHVNRCADKAEIAAKEEKLQAEQLSKAKDAVLNCPICGQHLKTQNARRTHLKKCSTKFGIAPTQLVTIVQKQQEEAMQLLNAGIVPPDALPPKKGRGRKKNTSTETNTNIITEPTRQVDEDTQVAIALSRSLLDQKQQQQSENTTGASSSAMIDWPLKPYKDGMEKKKRGKKKRDEPINTLLLESHEKIQERLANRAANMVLQKEQDAVSDDVHPTPELPESKVKANNTKVLRSIQHSFSQQVQSLWTMTALELDGSEKPRETYYVSTLMPPISPCKVVAGSKLRRMSEIPGRGRVSLSGQMIKEEEEDKQEDTPPLTQTAVVLAKLAAQSSSPVNLPTSSQGFCEDPREDQEEEEEEDHGPHLPRHLVKLQEDLERLMGMVELSDVTIRCSDGSLPGHCMMLAVRAPVMYKHVSHTEAGPVLDMSTFTTSAVSSVVRYLYTGVVDIALQVVPQVCDIAKRFHLQELMEACDQIMATDKKSGSSTSEDNIKKLLKEVWHEEDSNSKDGAVDQDDLRSNEDRSGTDAEEDNEEEVDKEREEEEMEELYTIMATQRQRKMSGNLQNEKADDTDDSDLEEFLQGSLSSQNSSHAVSLDSSMDKNRVEISTTSPRSHDTFVGLTDEEVLSKINTTHGTSSYNGDLLPIEEQEKKQLSFLNYDVNSDSGRDSIDSVLDSQSLQKKGQAEDFVLTNRMDEDSENHSKEERTESVLTDNKHSGCDIENNALQDIRENSFDYDMILGSWDNEKDEHEKQKVDVEILDSDSGDDGVITNEGMLVVEPDFPKTSPSPKKTKNQLPFVSFGSPRKSLNSLTSPTRKNLSDMDSMRRADQSHANSNVKRTSSVTSPGKILKSQRTLFQKDLQCSQKLRKHGNKLISPVDKDRLTSENLDDIIDVHSDDEDSFDNILKNGDLKELNCGDAKIDKEIRSSSKKDNSPSAKPSRDSMYDRDQTESHTPLTTRRASAASSCSLFSTPDMFADTQLTPQNGHTLTKVKNDPCSDKVLASPVNKEYERNPVVQDIKCSPLRKVGPITAVYSVKSSTKARSSCPKNLRDAKSVINNSLPSGTQKNVKTRKEDWTSKSTLQFSPSRMKLDFSSHSPTGKNNEKLAVNVVNDQSLSPVVMSPSGDLRKSSYTLASPIESQHKDSTPPSSPPTPPLSPTFGTSEMGDALKKESNAGNHFSFGIGHREDEEKTRSQIPTKNGTDNESDSNDEVEFVEESFVKDNDSPGAAPPIHVGSQPPLQDKTQPSLSAPSSGRYGQIPVPHNMSPSKSTSPESLTITPFDSPNISPVFKRNSSLGSQKRKRSYSSDESIEEVDVNNDSLDDGDGNKKRKVDSVHDSDGAEVVESVNLSLDNPDPGVWDDFDDGGGFVDFPVSPSQQLGGSELVGYVRQEQERHTKNRDQSGGDVDEDDDDGDGGYLSPPTFIETDEELDTVQQTSQPKKQQVVPLAETAPEKLPKEELEELGLDSFIWSEENEPLLDLAKQNADPKKETSTPVFQKKLKRPTVPSPFTPMPNYDDMVTPELKRAVQKYGVRPNMAKKRMRTLLTHIYKETHQYETDTDCEMSFHNEKSDDVGIPAKAVGPDSGDTSDGLPNIDATKEPKGIKRGPRGPRKTKQLAASVSGTERKVAAPKKSTNKVEVNSSPDGTLSRQTQISATRAKSVVSESRTKAHEISSEEEESFSTQEESEEERLEEALLEETIMPEEDEDISPSQQVSSADLHSKLMSFILSDKQLHSKILHYEPLELGDLQDAINAAGIRCGQQKLMEFLDEKCITFTMRKLQKGDRRKKQTKKKDKSVKSTQNNE